MTEKVRKIREIFKENERFTHQNIYPKVKGKYFAIKGRKVLRISKCLLLGSGPLSQQSSPPGGRKKSLKASSYILIQLVSYQFDAATKDLWSLINMLVLREKSEQNTHLDKAWQESMAFPWKPQKGIN